MKSDALRKLRRADAERPNLPGEHWLTLAAGAGLWLATRRHPSPAVRVLASVVATLLVARAATGRDVPPLLQRLPFNGRSDRTRALDWLG